MEVRYSHKKIRISGILHILLGLFILSVGIADRVKITEHLSSFSAKYVLAIWMGSWIFITGVVGICISLRGDSYNPQALRKTEVIAYLVLTIIAIGFAVALITCYSVTLAFIGRNEGSCSNCPTSSSAKNPREKPCSVRVALAVIVIIVSFLEFLAGLWTIFGCRVPASNPKEQEDSKPEEEDKAETDGSKPRDIEAKEPKRHIPSRIRFKEPSKRDKKHRKATLLEISRQYTSSASDPNV